MPCDEWSRLLERYRSAVNIYNETIINLSRVPGVVFNETWKEAEQARKHSDNCRTELLHHEHDHSCLGAGQPEGNNQMATIPTEELTLGDQGQSGG